MVQFNVPRFCALLSTALSSIVIGCSAGGADSPSMAGESTDGMMQSPVPPLNPPPVLPASPVVGGGEPVIPVDTPRDQNPPSTEVPPVGTTPPVDEQPPVDEPPPIDEGEGSPGLIRGADPTLDSAREPGSFDVDTLTNGLRDGPDYGTQTLHFPTDAEPPFAAVVIVPGFVSPESSIRAWGPFLASHGIVALTIGTNSTLDQPDARAEALLDGLETLRAEDARSDSPISGQLDLERLGVMGWSMGGGGTLIVANDHPELKAAVTMAAWSPGVRFADDEVPTLLLAGSADTLAGGQSQGFFESIPDSTPKMLFEVQGGPHEIANNPASANGEIGRYGLSWLKVFLEGDERYRAILLEPPTQQSDFQDNL